MKEIIFGIEYWFIFKVNCFEWFEGCVVNVKVFFEVVKFNIFFSDMVDIIVFIVVVYGEGCLFFVIGFFVGFNENNFIFFWYVDGIGVIVIIYFKNFNGGFEGIVVVSIFNGRVLVVMFYFEWVVIRESFFWFFEEMGKIWEGKGLWFRLF